MSDDRGIHEFFFEDPEYADHRVWGRISDPMTRRGFLKDSGLTTMSIALGMSIPFAEFMPAGLIPAAFAESKSPFVIEGKEGLRVLNDRPLNAETPPHLLDSDPTPTSRLFVRNNGIVPEIAKVGNLSGWTLNIDGEVDKQLKLSMKDLKSGFKNYTYQLVLECGGNGRAGYFPPAKGNQWTYGAIGCPMWTGVRLKDILAKAGLKKSAVYTGYYGMDIHPSGDLKKEVISRGTPIKKAIDDHTLIAFAMNGKPLPALHGFPARIVCPGYPGSASGKWLKRITIRNKVHDGTKMGGYAYRIPKNPVEAGEKVAKSQMKIIEQMPVKSLITFPESGIKVSHSKTFNCRGFAWTGDQKITTVHVSFDFGQTWKKANLKNPKNSFAWQRWDTSFKFPIKGYYEIWARATDTSGKMQPMVIPGWNPKGYINNAMPRIAVKVV